MCPHLMLIKFLPLADPVGFSSISNSMTAKTALTKPYATQTFGLSRVLCTEPSHVCCISCPLASWLVNNLYQALLPYFYRRNTWSPQPKHLFKAQLPPPPKSSNKYWEAWSNTQPWYHSRLSFLCHCGYSVWLTFRLSITVLSFWLSGTRMFFFSCCSLLSVASLRDIVSFAHKPTSQLCNWSGLSMISWLHCCVRY